MTNTSNEKFLLEMERRFKKTCELTCDLSPYPLKNKASNVETNKAKSKEFSEVFTPLWLVDRMIGQVDFESANSTTLDLCAGYGQFSIRLMRSFYKTFPNWDLKKFLRETHAFSELQLSSCYKLLYIFSPTITLFIGDSTHLNKLPVNARGLWCYIESYGYWVNLNKTIKSILSPEKDKLISEEKFVSSIELLIKGLNETYSTMKERYNITANQLTPKLRLEVIDQLNSLVKNDKGETVVKVVPENIVGDMLDSVEDLEKKSILVLYNCEIIEQLITKKKIKPEQITFGTDFNGVLKSEIMKKMYGVDTINFSSETAFLHASFKGRKFDVCLSNPPYNGGLDIDILSSLMFGNIAQEYIWVHPSTWLIDQKNKDNKFLTVKNKINTHLKSVKFFNGNPVFDIKLFVPCLITHIDFNWIGKPKVNYFGDSFIANDVFDITKYGKNWETIVKPFYKKVRSLIQNDGSVMSHRIKVDSGKVSCQLARVRGNINSSSSTLNEDMVSTDFYTMMPRDAKEIYGIRKALDKRGGPSYEFALETERDNFINYLKSDFARMCFSLLKNKSDVDCGELTTIPWLDFTQAWDDDKLFLHFDINKDTQDYIRKFLPDYYGIRK